MSQFHMKMRACRHSVELKATIEPAGGGTLSTFITDISLDGCGVLTPLRMGEYLTIEILRVGRFRVQVRWCLMGKSGLRFETEAVA